MRDNEVGSWNVDKWNRKKKEKCGDMKRKTGVRVTSCPKGLSMAPL